MSTADGERVRVYGNGNRWESMQFSESWALGEAMRGSTHLSWEAFWMLGKSSQF
jgi:hypothetical protein